MGHQKCATLFFLLLLITFDMSLVESSGSVNLALKKPAFQSGTPELETFSRNASVVVDGNKNTSFWNGQSCTYTIRDKFTWISVDLENIYLIGRVVITNRDKYGERLSNFIIGTTDKHPVTSSAENHLLESLYVCVRENGTLTDGETRTYFCGYTGRYVVLVLLTGRVANLCELEVYEFQAGNLANHKPAFQSSIFNNEAAFKAEAAVDGNFANKITLSGGKYHSSCTQTTNENNPWWAVDLLEHQSIGYVVLTNRGDLNNVWKRLSHIRIGTTDTSPVVKAPSLDSMTVCARQESSLFLGETRAFPCIASGRYVVILLEKQDMLTLCEVQVFREREYNVALGKPSFSVTNRFSKVAGFANNALNSSMWPLQTTDKCALTWIHTGSWWAVDLLGIYQIDYVVIFRAFINSDLQAVTKNFIIAVNDVSPRPHPQNLRVCVDQNEEERKELHAYPCNKRGRYVVIMGIIYGSISLCEVQVFGQLIGSELRNIAVRKPAYLSTTHGSNSASNAVDGNSDGQYFHGSCASSADGDTSAWWAVDLQGTYQVDSVAVVNRGDCCSGRLKGFVIGTTDVSPEVTPPRKDNMRVCASWHTLLQKSERFTLACNATGRYVAILQTNTQTLTLCEVQVYGEILDTPTSKPLIPYDAGAVTVPDDAPVASDDAVVAQDDTVVVPDNAVSAAPDVAVRAPDDAGIGLDVDADDNMAAFGPNGNMLLLCGMLTIGMLL